MNKNLIKKPVFIFSLIIIIGALIGGYVYFGGIKKPSYDFIIAKKSNLIQEVSVTGRVKPATSLDLAFEKSSKVSNVYIKVGDKITVGQLLVTLNNAELVAQLTQAQANLESAKAELKQYQAALQIQQAKLDELKRGTRPEEIQIAETKVLNARKSLTDAETNLEKIKNKAQADLKEDYESALAAVQKSVSLGKNSLLVLTDIQYAHFNKYDQESNSLAEAKAAAVLALLGAQNAGRSTTETISALNGGNFGTVQNTVNNPTDENIDQALLETASALQKVKTALEAIPIITEITTTERTNINTEKSNINTEIATVSSKEQAINVQKTTNASNIATTEASVNSEKNALASAQDDLALKKAGPTAEQIAAQEAQVRQTEANIISQEAKIKEAEANVKNYQAQIDKTILRSPINGLVTKQEAKVGEIVSANTSIVSLISEAQFEIEADIYEEDVTKVKVGDPVDIKIVAFPQKIFKGKVISINPAEKIIEEVVHYEVTANFEEIPEAVRPGMTVDIIIRTASKENILVVPRRAVKKIDNRTVISILKNGKIEEREIKTGLKGSDFFEVLSGLEEGEQIVTGEK